MPSSNGVSSRTALLLPASARSGLPRLSPNTNKRLILAPYDTCLRMRLLLQTYLVLVRTAHRILTTASTTLMLPRGQAKYYTYIPLGITRFEQATSAPASSPPRTPLSRFHRSKGPSEDQEKKKKRKKKEAKAKQVGYETAPLDFVADSFRFPNRAVPRRLSLVNTHMLLAGARKSNRLWLPWINSNMSSENQEPAPLPLSRRWPANLVTAPFVPRVPGSPRTHASLLLVGCPPLMHCLDGKGVMRCHFVACTQQQLRFQLNPYRRSWPVCHGIRQ